MGLFGRKDEVENDLSSTDVQDTITNDLDGIDFTKYDLTTLGDDIRSIMDVPGAVLQTAKWSFGIPIVVGIVSWLVFSGRMPTWVVVPFVFGAVVLSGIGSIMIGGFAVARKRLTTVSEATDKVVSVIGEMHADVVQIKEGASTTSVRQLATGLMQHAVLPITFGVAEGLVAGSTGPLAKLGSRGTDISMKLVERSVIAAIKRLPDSEIGAMAEDAAAVLPATTDTLTSLNEQYLRIAENIDSIVGGVSKATLGSVGTAAGFAMIPLLLWLALGLIFS